MDIVKPKIKGKIFLFSSLRTYLFLLCMIRCISSEKIMSNRVWIMILPFPLDITIQLFNVCLQQQQQLYSKRKKAKKKTFESNNRKTEWKILQIWSVLVSCMWCNCNLLLLLSLYIICICSLSLSLNHITLSIAVQHRI